MAFSGTNAPYSADGRYFTRVGASNKMLSASELSALIIKRERAQPVGLPVIR